MKCFVHKGEIIDKQHKINTYYLQNDVYKYHFISETDVTKCLLTHIGEYQGLYVLEKLNFMPI